MPIMFVTIPASYVAHAEKALAVINARTLELITDIKLPGSPESFQLAAESPRIYVNTPSAGLVAVIDRDKAEVTERYPLTRAKSNFPMALDENNHRLFVGCRDKPMVIV